MSFHEIRFPERLSLGSVGGPERLTEVVELASGHEERNTPWAHSRRRYDAGVSLRSIDDVHEVVAFFEARRGRLHGFRWKDWADFKSCRPSETPSAFDQVIGTGDGETISFELTKEYRSGFEGYVRPIRKPVTGSVRVALGDDEKPEGWQVDPTTGKLTFGMPPDEGVVVTAGFAFDVPVRFDTDAIMVSLAGFEAGEIPDVPVVEIRL
jgi:uncharacterized protein (TIGR02217 family)